MPVYLKVQAIQPHMILYLAFFFSVLSTSDPFPLVIKHSVEPTFTELYKSLSYRWARLCLLFLRLSGH